MTIAVLYYIISVKCLLGSHFQPLITCLCFCFKVQQRDVPGIDAAYLAMDTEEGVEVVWNEVRFSERKNFKAQEDKIRQVFDNLIQLEHPNIVKFHKYWIDSRDDKPRVNFSPFLLSIL